MDDILTIAVLFLLVLVSGCATAEQQRAFSDGMVKAFGDASRGMAQGMQDAAKNGGSSTNCYSNVIGNQIYTRCD